MTEAVPFRLSAKNLFLTYPRCTLTKEEALRQLQAVAVLDIREYVIGRELHEDGTPHLHVYLALRRKCNIRSGTTLDLKEGDTVYHGNYQGARTPTATIAYCKKDGDSIQSAGIDEDEERPTWGEMREKAQSVDEYLHLVQHYYPRDAALNWERLKLYAAAQWRPTVEVYVPDYTREQFDLVPREITDWVSEFIDGGGARRPKSLVIISETRCGKTEYARSLGRHMYFSHNINARLWDDDAKYTVIDDVAYPFNCWREFLGCQREFDFTQKYQPIRRLKYGKPTIYLTNKELWEWKDVDANDTRWLQGNCIFVKLFQPLFIE